MDTDSKQAYIRHLATINNLKTPYDRIRWSRHAITELIADELTRRDVEQGLQHCCIIEDYPDGHRPLPDCLVLLQLRSGDPVHAVIAIDADQDRLLIVTVYRPDQGEWESDARTRK